tara:strand:- start:1952 stop:2524 length:573 start_codon:yes stop_codon:yes gene_type:complete
MLKIPKTTYMFKISPLTKAATAIYVDNYCADIFVADPGTYLFVMAIRKDTVMTTKNCTSPTVITEYLSKLAQDLAYSDAEIAAGLEYADRAKRRSHPPGEWDTARRFYAHELTNSVLSCRCPSRAWPNSQMLAARTAAHCAEVYKADNTTHVRRIGTAYNKLLDGDENDGVVRLLTKGVRKRKADLKRPT